MIFSTRTIFRAVMISVVAVTLASCAAQTKVDKIESIKDQGYDTVPKKLSIVLLNGVEFSEGLKNNVVARINGCGVQANFFLYNNFKNADFFKSSDTVMSVGILNQDTTTKTAVGYFSAYVSRATYEFTLQDPKTQKNLWRSHMDFRQADPKATVDNAYRNEQSPDLVWADALVAQMKKDGLFPGCV